MSSSDETEVSLSGVVVDKVVASPPYIVVREPWSSEIRLIVLLDAPADVQRWQTVDVTGVMTTLETDARALTASSVSVYKDTSRRTALMPLPVLPGDRSFTSEEAPLQLSLRGEQQMMESEELEGPPTDQEPPDDVQYHVETVAEALALTPGSTVEIAAKPVTGTGTDQTDGEYFLIGEDEGQDTIRAFSGQEATTDDRVGVARGTITVGSNGKVLHIDRGPGTGEPNLDPALHLVTRGSVAYAKFLPPDAPGWISYTHINEAVVTCVFNPTVCYVRELNGAMGLRIEFCYWAALEPGDVVSLHGWASLMYSGERRLTDASATILDQVDPPKPLVMRNCAVAGADLPNVRAVTQRGVTGSGGPNNVGMLVRASGRVVGIEGGLLEIDDGSCGAEPCPVWVSLPSGATPPEVGDFVIVTGASSLTGSSSAPERLVRVATADDIQSGCWDDTDDPTVTITSPAEDGATAETYEAISGTASDTSRVTKVEVQINGGAWADATYTPSTHSWTTPWAPARDDYTISVRAYDCNGHVATATRTVSLVDVLSTARPEADAVAAGLYGAVITWPSSVNQVAVGPAGGNGVLRKDVAHGSAFDAYSLSRMTEAGLGSLRFGDVSANTYYWRFGVGPQQYRPIETSAYGQRSKHSYGIEEHLALCALVGAEPVIVVPLKPKLTSTLAESAQAAANLVRYCNEDAGVPDDWAPTSITGDEENGWTETAVSGVSWTITAADAPAGYFGWVRQHFSGHGPYGVHYFEIGNQPFLNGYDGEEYVTLLESFEEEMESADDSIKLIASVPTTREGYGVFREYVLESSAYDYLAPHWYISPADPASGAEPTQDDYDALFSFAYDTVPGDLRVFAPHPGSQMWPTELNTHFGFFGGGQESDRFHNTRLKSALACAVEQLVLAAHDAKGSNVLHGPLVSEGTGETTLQNTSDPFRMITVDRVNTIPVDPGNPNGPAVATERRWVAPHFYVQKLLNHLAVGTADTTETTYPRVFAQGFTGEDKYRLFLVNYSTTGANVRVSLGEDVEPSGPAILYQLSGTNGMESTNECGQGTQVHDPTVAWVTVSGNPFVVGVPAASMLVYDISLSLAPTDLRGVVTDVAGRPMMGADVTATDLTPPGSYTESCTTDAFGVYTLPDLQGTSYDLTVEMPGYLTEIRQVDFNVMNFTLTPRISGTVRLPEQQGGDPVPGAAVWAVPSGGGDAISTVSDCDGTFVLPVAAGTYQVFAGNTAVARTRPYDADVSQSASCISFTLDTTTLPTQCPQ